MTWGDASRLYRKHVNPDYISMLEALDYGRSFVRAEGIHLYDEDGIEYLDFLSGFGVHNLGHNPPSVLAALQRCLSSTGASMLNIDAPVTVGRLAERLTSLTHPELRRSVFANSGAEAVEIAIRTARAATSRTAMVACRRGYHGLTTGALALLGDDRLKRPFGPLLPEVEHIPFGDTDALREVCRRRRPAAFFVEPIQAEGGIVVPESGYLREAANVCRKSGCLLVVDEIQTGLGRTGTVFATDFGEVVPDILLVGKALSAGLIPVSAALMTADVWGRAFSGPDRCLLDSPSCAGGLLAMTAGLEAISLLEAAHLADRAREQGMRLLEGLRRLSQRHGVIKEVRGRGLLVGVEFRAPDGLLTRAVPQWAREGLYAHVISAKLLRDHRIIVQPCSLAHAVLRAEPPLVVGAEDVDRFIHALDETLGDCPTHDSATFAAFRKTVLRGRL